MLTKLRAAAICAVGAVTVFLVVGTVAASAQRANPSPADPYRDVVVSPDSAVAAVKAIVGTSSMSQSLQGPSVSGSAVQTNDLASAGIIDGALGRFYKVEGSQVSAYVDSHDGHVGQLLVLSYVPSATSATPISPEQAQSIASSYLAARGISVSGLTCNVSTKDRGIAHTYVVTWQRLVNGAVVPDSRLVEMDANTGFVFRMYDTTRPYSAPPNPTVTQQQAIKSAATAAIADLSSAAGSPGSVPSGLSAPSYTVGGEELDVSFNADGVQQLGWTVRLTIGGIDHYIVNVDAATGATTIIGRG